MRTNFNNEETIERRLTAKLPDALFGATAQPIEIELGANSHPGKVRSENQDHFSVSRRRRSREVLMSNLPSEFLDSLHEDAYVMAVADGLGGESFGKMASSLALRTGLELSMSEVKWCFKVNDQERYELLEKMNVFLRLMDKALVERGRTQREMGGMGTTLTAAYSVGPELFIGHVGDSRAYLFRDASLQQLTRDHTQAQEMVDAGLIEPTSVEFERRRHILTNCLGGDREGVDVETHQLHLQDGDTLLLCTDGLTDMVQASEIESVLRAGQHAQNTAEALVQAALDHGGKDNVTVVIARYSMPEAK